MLIKIKKLNEKVKQEIYYSDFEPESNPLRFCQNPLPEDDDASSIF